MPETLTAPISEAEYLNMPLLQPPSDFTGDKMTLLLNRAWAWVTDQCQQPLSKTLTTDIYDLATPRHANVQPNGYMRIIPRYTPLVSVSSISFSQNYGQDGWTASSNYDVVGDTVYVYDCPYVRGDWGLVKCIYYSGYETVPEELKELCGIVAARLLSGAYFPTQAGGSVLPSWMPNDAKACIQRHKRVQ